MSYSAPLWPVSLHTRSQGNPQVALSDSCHNDEKNNNYTRLTVLLQAETSISGASCPGLAGFADDVLTVRKCKLRQSLPTLHSPRAGNPRSIVPDLIPMGEVALI